MNKKHLNITILGLSITSSWGNGHATTFRGLVRELHRNGHTVHFLEREVPWYAAHRDLPNPAFCETILYNSLDDLKQNHRHLIENADLVIVGSYVPEGVEVGKFVVETASGVTAFYDIDTPVTLAKMRKDDFEYLHPDLIPQYGMYLSFTGGPTLTHLEQHYGSPMAKPFYCSVDPALYYPEQQHRRWDMGYLGTYSADRQPPLQRLMLEAAAMCRSAAFVIAGSQYPERIDWPANVARIEHLPPSEHRSFYNSQRFTLNITRADMVLAGYSPSVRLFEAAACGTPIISDYWEGIETIFRPGEEIFISHTAEETAFYLMETSEEDRLKLAGKARERVMAQHTAAHRATELDNYYSEALLCKQPSKQQLPVN